MNKIVKCRACNADIIFMPTKKGKNNPVDAHTVEDGDLMFDYNKHQSHFLTCPQASKFKKSIQKTEPKAPAPSESADEQIGLL